WPSTQLLDFVSTPAATSCLIVQRHPGHSCARHCDRMPAFTVGTPQDLTYERVDGDCVPIQHNVSVRQRWNQRHDGNDNGSTDSLHAVLQVGLCIAQPRARSSQAHARSSGRYLLNAGSRANRGKPVTQPRVTQPFRRWASGDEATWEELVP